MAETFTKLASYSTANDSATSITLSNIPQGYTDLFVVANGRGNTGGGALNVRFNGDTGNNYQLNYHWNNSSGSTAGSGSGTQGGMGRITQRSSNINGGGWAYIANYTSAFYKSWTSRSIHNNINISYNNTWRSTAAITSMTISIESSSAFDTDFRFDFYGILKAS
jgi:hypothetical protein